MEASALRAPAGLTRLALPSALLRLRSDDQLVSLFRAGSEEAFGVIHDRYRTRLFAYTRQMLGGSRSDAEDALQDVFLRAYNALRADSREVVLKAWLYRVAHNRCIDHLRRPTPPPADVFEVSRAPLPDPLAEAERRDDLRRLVADVQRLPDQQRSALLMRELEGLTYAELAVALETTIPAVKSLLVRARIGLVEAAEARDAACSEIRNDLALSYGRGVRASARARRHMRECDGCREYRTGLRAVRATLGALTPSGSPFGLVAKLLGLGGAGGGAAAGGSAAAGGGAAIVGGGVAAGTTAKVAAVVCCAALTAGGAVELKKDVGAQAPGGARAAAGASSDGRSATSPLMPHGRPAAQRSAMAVAAGQAMPAAPRRSAAGRAAGGAASRGARRRAGAADPFARDGEPISPHVAERPRRRAAGTAAGEAPGVRTGGALAPTDDPAAADTADPAPAPVGDAVQSAVAPLLGGPGSGPSGSSASSGGSTSGQGSGGSGTASAGSGTQPSASGASTSSGAGTAGSGTTSGTAGGTAQPAGR